MEFAQLGGSLPADGQGKAQAPAAENSWVGAWSSPLSNNDAHTQHQHAGAGSDPSTQWKPKIHLQWQAPFFSGGGYSSEAISYVSELSKWLHVGITQHGDSFNAQFAQGLPPALRSTLIAASQLPLDPARTVQICHSEPGAWWVPTPNYHTAECPSRRALYTIGRTMFETGEP
jgi:hypothetical protein